MFFQHNIIRAIVRLLIVFLVSGWQLAAAVDATFSKLQEQAVAGDAKAQHELALHYYRGDGVRKSYDTAYVWFETAANQGLAKSQHQMGHIYERGVGFVDKDKKRSFEWYHKAAKQGYTLSQTKIAFMYLTGTGVSKSRENYQLWSNRVLAGKGLLDTPEEAAKKAEKAEKAAKAKAKKAKADKAKRAVKANPPVQPVSPPVTTGKPAAEPIAVASPQRTPEQEKAWRREQARRLVEESNKEAAIIGDWTEEE